MCVLFVSAFRRQVFQEQLDSWTRTSHQECCCQGILIQKAVGVGSKTRVPLFSSMFTCFFFFLFCMFSVCMLVLEDFVCIASAYICSPFPSFFYLLCSHTCFFFILTYLYNRYLFLLSCCLFFLVRVVYKLLYTCTYNNLFLLPCYFLFFFRSLGADVGQLIQGHDLLG